MAPKDHGHAQQAPKIKQRPQGERQGLRQVTERHQENRLVGQVEKIPHAIVQGMKDVLQMLAVESAQIVPSQLSRRIKHGKPTGFAIRETPKHKPKENRVCACQNKEQARTTPGSRANRLTPK